jgi:hypothetical protein
MLNERFLAENASFVSHFSLPPAVQQGSLDSSYAVPASPLRHADEREKQKTAQGAGEIETMLPLDCSTLPGSAACSEAFADTGTDGMYSYYSAFFPFFFSIPASSASRRSTSVGCEWW